MMQHTHTDRQWLTQTAQSSGDAGTIVTDLQCGTA